MKEDVIYFILVMTHFPFSKLEQPKVMNILENNDYFFKTQLENPFEERAEREFSNASLSLD